MQCIVLKLISIKIKFFIHQNPSLACTAIGIQNLPHFSHTGYLFLLIMWSITCCMILPYYYFFKIQNRFHYAARTWEAVKKSQLMAEYNRLLHWANWDILQQLLLGSKITDWSEKHQYTGYWFWVETNRQIHWKLENNGESSWGNGQI